MHRPLAIFIVAVDSFQTELIFYLKVLSSEF